MKRYRATAVIAGGKYLGEVDAENEEQAKEKAWNLPEAFVSVCHQCTDDVGELEIADIDVEEVEES